MIIKQIKTGLCELPIASRLIHILAFYGVSLIILEMFLIMSIFIIILAMLMSYHLAMDLLKDHKLNKPTGL